MNNGVLQTSVAFGALTAGAHEVCRGLFGFDPGASAIHQKGGENERKGDHNGNKDGAELHDGAPGGIGRGLLGQSVHLRRPR